MSCFCSKRIQRYSVQLVKRVHVVLDVELATGVPRNSDRFRAIVTDALIDSDSYERGTSKGGFQFPENMEENNAVFPPGQRERNARMWFHHSVFGDSSLYTFLNRMQVTSFAEILSGVRSQVNCLIRTEGAAYQTASSSLST
jgi:hypothetical protein